MYYEQFRFYDGSTILQKTHHTAHQKFTQKDGKYEERTKQEITGISNWKTRGILLGMKQSVIF